jgi:hypothetical protein
MRTQSSPKWAINTATRTASSSDGLTLEFDRDYRATGNLWAGGNWRSFGHSALQSRCAEGMALYNRAIRHPCALRRCKK